MSKLTKIRLVLIITGLSTGGAEGMLLKILQKIDRSRFSPMVISLSTKGEIGGHIEILGIPVYALQMKSGAVSPIRFLHLIKLLRKLKPDVVHTWMYHADLLGGLAARLSGTKAVAWGIRHSNLSAEHNKRSTLQVMKLCAHLSGWLPQRILTCSEQAQSIHVAAGYCAHKMWLIPNGFDLSRFQPDHEARNAVRAEFSLTSDTPLVGIVARDDPQKNHTGFIEAAARVHAAIPRVHFVLAGLGVDRNNGALTKLIEEKGLTDVVHLLGRRDDIPRLMASFDLLVSSSSFGEAFPNVLGEAMASGVPCVATDVGDSALIVGSTGLIVQPADSYALADAIQKLLELNPKARREMGVAARRRVEQMFDIEKIVKHFENFYLELVCAEVAY
jgi:glycosyltransferase involved in cell wall biosynthesis